MKNDLSKSDIRSALDAAHRARDVHAAKTHVEKMAAKNLKEANKPPRAMLFAEQLENAKQRQQWFSEWQAEERQAKERQAEERMRRWRSAKGDGLLDR